MSILCADIDLLWIMASSIYDWPAIIMLNRYYYQLLSRHQIYQQLRLVGIKSSIQAVFEAACSSCYNGKNSYMLIKHLVINYPINIHCNADYYFRNACYAGNESFAHLLYDLGIATNSPINLHVCREEPLRNCVAKGHLTMAKWLWSLSEFDVSIMDYDVFYQSAQNRFHDMYQWLLDVSVIPSAKKEHFVRLFDVCSNQADIE